MHELQVLDLAASYIQTRCVAYWVLRSLGAALLAQIAWYRGAFLVCRFLSFMASLPSRGGAMVIDTELYVEHRQTDCNWDAWATAAYKNNGMANPAP